MTPDGETVIWRHTRASMGGLGCGCAGLVGGLFVAGVLYEAVSLPVWWAVCLVAVLVAVSAAIGAQEPGQQVRTAEFTNQGVRLVSRSAIRTVDVADLTGVVVEHSGNTDQGYVTTSLRLLGAGPSEPLVGNYDTTLAPALTRLLGAIVDVSEVYEALDPPTSSA